MVYKPERKVPIPMFYILEQLVGTINPTIELSTLEVVTYLSTSLILLTDELNL